jgi:hypothetical protein
MQGDGGTGSGEGVNLGRVTELFFEAGGGSGLDELTEAGTGIGETPRGNLDAKFIQRGEDLLRPSIDDIGHFPTPLLRVPYRNILSIEIRNLANSLSVI